MDFELPEEHRLAYESALQFALREIKPLTAELERSDDFPRWLWQKLADQGYTGIGIPESYGGSGGDFLMAALVARAIGRANGGIAMSFGAHLNLCAHNILRNGTEEQKQRYLPKLAAAEMIGGLALTEPDAGSDAMGIRTTARAVDGGFVLNGTKVFITNGPIADLLIVYAKTKPEAGSRGITAFLFETKTPGYHVARKIEKVGMHGSPTGELVFEEAFVPAENVLGRVDEGYRVVMSGLDLERAFFAVSIVGGIEAALELSLKYARERQQFGQPIANFQLIQAKLADMYTDLEAARLLAHRALWLAQQGQRVSKEAAAALLFTARAQWRAANEALQIHGGWGYTTDFEVERMWRDARLAEIGAGTTEIRQLIIARELLGLR
ncbi:acyl-CoA dehydrogenase family protein [Thermogemmatispora carboxidivorans]|uniref:acyl-CoA dehydrogenase family protein n=1 Tax=Thermogemmatispora carboxidivorans TaxID=1382306 RepID=UPI00069AA781|nr:acyl-CoA dehydrogenase family protein [Thermogemmatispora carboxidivorans]